MDNKNDILWRMLMDWCQTWIDGPDWSGCGLEWEDDSPEWEEDNELDWGYDLEELEDLNPHYENEDDDDPNTEGDW